MKFFLKNLRRTFEPHAKVARSPLIRFLFRLQQFPGFRAHIQQKNAGKSDTVFSGGRNDFTLEIT